MGVGTRSKAWRFTDINKDYSVGRATFSLVTHLSMTLSNSSSLLLTPLVWLYPRKSAIPLFNTLQSIGVNAGYPHSLTCIGLTMYVFLMSPIFC